MEHEHFEKHATTVLQRKVEELSASRCMRCWHNRAQRCICHRLPVDLHTDLPIKVLVLMHHKEYLNAGDDAKLLCAMLPADRVQLYVYGREGDLAALDAELAVDAEHTLLLWPGDGAATVDEWLRSRPRWQPMTPTVRFIDSAFSTKVEHEAWARSRPRPPRPTLRVLVLDGVYRDARAMFRAVRKRAEAQGRVPTPHVALHPSTLSVYHRAQHGYGDSQRNSASATSATSRGGSDAVETESGLQAEAAAGLPALRICTVEAVALLYQELGEPDGATRAMVQAVVANNEAVANKPGAGPNPNPTGRRAKARAFKEKLAACTEGEAEMLLAPSSSHAWLGARDRASEHPAAAQAG